MTKLALTQFIANAQSTVDFGRETTETEKTAMKNFQKNIITNGRMVGVDVVDAFIYSNRWTDINDANGYVTLCNGFSPAPISATAEAV